VIIDEFLLKFGIDADITPLKHFIAVVTDGVKGISGAANWANDALANIQSSANSAVAAIDEVSSNVALNIEASSIEQAIAAANGLSTSLLAAGNAASNATTPVKHLGNQASESAKKVAVQAEGLQHPFRKIKILALGVTAVISGLAAGVMSFIGTSLAGVKDLSEQKGLLYDITEQEIKQADSYAEAMNKTGLSVQSLKTKIALNLMPALTDAVNGFNAWLRANKELLTKGLTIVIQSLVKVVQLVVNTFLAINKLVESTFGWKAAIMFVVAAIGIFKRAMLMAFITQPVTWVLAAITGLLLILDDLMTYLDGGESLFGAFWKPAVEWTKRVIAWCKQLHVRYKDMLGKLLASFSQIWEGLKSQLTALFDWLVTSIGAVVDIVEKIFENLTEAIKKPFIAAFDLVMSYYDKTIGKISGLWKILKGTVGGVVDSVKATIGMDFATSAASPNPANSGQIGAVGAPTINGGDVKATININASNAIDAQRGVERGLTNANRQALANMQGVLR
jgi:hypothetical protein